MSNFCPFFINSNICLKKEDIADYDSFMRAICGNTGNSYITYALMKELGTEKCGILLDLLNQKEIESNKG